MLPDVHHGSCETRQHERLDSKPKIVPMAQGDWSITRHRVSKWCIGCRHGQPGTGAAWPFESGLHRLSKDQVASKKKKRQVTKQNKTKTKLVGKNYIHLSDFQRELYFCLRRASLQSVGRARDSWSGGPGFDPRCGCPLPTVTGWDTSHGLPSLSRVWQHSKSVRRHSWGPSAI